MQNSNKFLQFSVDIPESGDGSHEDACWDHKHIICKGNSNFFSFYTSTLWYLSCSTLWCLHYFNRTRLPSNFRSNWSISQFDSVQKHHLWVFFSGFIISPSVSGFTLAGQKPVELLQDDLRTSSWVLWTLPIKMVVFLQNAMLRRSCKSPSTTSPCAR